MASYQAHKTGERGTTLCENAAAASTISTPCAGDPHFTVQVGPSATGKSSATLAATYWLRVSAKVSYSRLQYKEIADFPRSEIGQCPLSSQEGP
jgi:hypothetical protein